MPSTTSLSLALVTNRAELTAVALRTDATFAAEAAVQRQLNVDLTFEIESGTTWTFSAYEAAAAAQSGVAVAGLVTFASATPSANTVDTNGRMPLVANHHSAVELSATSRCDGGEVTGGDSVVASTTTFANLEPGCNDIDVGAATGAPLGAATAGASLGVAVRVRVCNCEALAAEVRLYFLRAALAPTSDAPPTSARRPARGTTTRARASVCRMTCLVPTSTLSC